MLDSTPHEPRKTPPTRNSPPRGTPPHERPEPVLRLYHALRSRGVRGIGGYAPGYSLRSSRVRGGGLRGRIRLSAPAPEKSGGFLALRQTPAPRARSRPSHYLRRPPRLSGSPRSPRDPRGDDAIDGPSERNGRRHDSLLESQRPLRGRRARRGGRSPRTRSTRTPLRPRSPGGPMVARGYRSPYPSAGPRGGGDRSSLRDGASGIEKARRSGL